MDNNIFEPEIYKKLQLMGWTRPNNIIKIYNYYHSKYTKLLPNKDFIKLCYDISRKIHYELPYVKKLNNKIIINNDIIMIIKSLFDQGGFGKIYKAKCDIIPCEFIIKKMILLKKYYLMNFLIEMYIHSILYLHSPYIPRVFAIGIDRKHNFYLIIEKLENTIDVYIRKLLFEKKMTETILIHIILQILHIIYILQEKYNFMHRDLKDKNIMYCKTQQRIIIAKIKSNEKEYNFVYNNNGILIKFIDFGFSYIKYNNIIITSENYYFDHKFNKSHDVYFFFIMFYIFNYKYILKFNKIIKIYDYIFQLDETIKPLIDKYINKKNKIQIFYDIVAQKNIKELYPFNIIKKITLLE